MTDAERISIKDYLKERFDKLDVQYADIHARLESLETDRDRNRGRIDFIKNTARTIGGLLAAVLAVLGIKSQTS